jgi:hypothetical protein
MDGDELELSEEASCVMSLKMVLGDALRIG